MTRTVNGEHMFAVREKEVLRKMLWQVAAFCGVEVLTYCIMSNHFHVLVRVPESLQLSDRELLRRYKILYPTPTKYQTASIAVMESQLKAGGEDAEVIREKLLARMGDVSEFMKTLKQRFSVWYNRSHQRYGTLWAERFKSVLVEGQGNPLQTMAAYIDLNPVRAGIVEDPKNYRFCGYAEAVAGHLTAKRGLELVWADHDGAASPCAKASEDRCLDGAASPCAKASEDRCLETAPYLQAHRELIFGKRASDAGLSDASRKKALKVLEKGDAILPKSTVLRCRVRYFTDGAILGSKEFVRGYVGAWQLQKQRKYPPKVSAMRGANWGDLVTIQGLRKQVFS